MKFFELVKEMRAAQKEYFKARPYTQQKEIAKEKAMRLERLVDKTIADYEQERAAEEERKQQTFDFGGENDPLQNY